MFGSAIQDREKVLAIFIEAFKLGTKFLCHPTVHSLTYYLFTEGLKLNRYSYGVGIYPPFAGLDEPGKYPRSVRLDKDLGILIGLDMLDLTASDVPKYTLSDKIVKDKKTMQSYLEIFDGQREMPYERFQQEVKSYLELLKKSPKEFYESCYDLYVRNCARAL